MAPETVAARFERYHDEAASLAHMEMRKKRLAALPPGQSLPMDGYASEAEAEMEQLRAHLDAEGRKLARIVRGVRRAQGSTAANVLEDRYITGHKWRTVAQINEIGVTTAIRRHDAAIAWIAEVGYTRAAEIGASTL